MERRIQAETVELVERARRLRGVAFNPNMLLHTSSTNVIHRILFGQPLDADGDRLRYVIDLIRRTSQSYVPELDFIPALRFLPHFRRRVTTHMQLFEDVIRFLDASAEECLVDGRSSSSSDEETMEDCSFVRSYVEAEGPGYDRQQFLCTLRDLFVGGMETSALTLEWGLMLIANHPDVERRLHEEIDAVISRGDDDNDDSGDSGRMPSLEDQACMPYVEATILEIMRLKTLLLLSFPYATMRDTTVGGYFVPKDAVVSAL